MSDKLKTKMTVSSKTAGLALAAILSLTLLFDGRPANSQDVSGDLNQFTEQVFKVGSAIADALKVNKSVIYNNSNQSVRFFVYNYADSLYWIPAMQTLVAPHNAAIVAASGVAFKINPDQNKDQQFLVEPHKAYVYSGPGAVKEIKK